MIALRSLHAREINAREQHDQVRGADLDLRTPVVRGRKAKAADLEPLVPDRISVFFPVLMTKYFGLIYGDSSLNSTIPELPGSGWLAAEPEATPQTHSLRPWGFPTVSPSHPGVFSHHGIQRITVEFSEKSRLKHKECQVED